MASKDALRKKVGQLFIIGFEGKSVPADFADFIQEYHLGGTIYFNRNIESPAQIAELSNQIQFESRPRSCPPLFISVDHEGGKVTRLSKPFTMFAGNDHLGELGSAKIAFDFGAVLGRELKAVGINMNYAPVVDVNSNPKNPIINTRAFGEDAELCGKMGSAVARGIQKMGVIAVAKHFPGHGDTTEDSHLALPKVEKTLEELEELELIPFKRVIRSRCEAIMTAHILNPKIDKKYPATMSHATIQGVLRDQMRFTRLVISDDLEMKAIADHYDADEAAVLSIKAGCDLLIYRGDNGLPVNQIEAIAKAVESGEIPKATFEAALERIAAAKKAYAELKAPVDVDLISRFVGTNEHSTLAMIVESKQLPPGHSETV